MKKFMSFLFLLMLGYAQNCRAENNFVTINQNHENYQSVAVKKVENDDELYHPHVKPQNSNVVRILEVGGYTYDIGYYYAIDRAYRRGYHDGRRYRHRHYRY